MAEQFKKLVDASFSESNFTDGSTTIYTASQDTILKDAYITPDEGLNLVDTYLEVDGKNIGSANATGTTTLAGHEIIPAGSSIQLKTSSYPFVFEKVIGVMSSGTDAHMYYYSYIEKADGGIVPVSDTGIQFSVRTTATGSSRFSEMEDILYTSVIGGGTAMWYTVHDNNSVQQIYHTGATNTTTGSDNSFATSNVYNSNYKTLAIQDDRRTLTPTQANNFPLKGFMQNSGGTWETFSGLGTAMPSYISWSGTAYSKYGSGGHHQSPTSSYPRGHAAQGIYWYVPSNGNPSELYGKSLQTGRFFRFNPMPLSISYQWGSFITSVDVPADTVHVYSQINSTTIRWFTLNIPWSELRTSTDWTNNTRTDYGSSDFTYKDISLPFTLSTSFHGSLMGYTATGGFRVRDNSGIMYKFENGEIMHSYAAPPLSGYESVGTPTSSYPWRHFGVPVLSSEISSAGLTAPEIKVSLHGITQ